MADIALARRLSQLGATQETTMGTNVLSSTTAALANLTVLNATIEPESFFSETEREAIGTAQDSLRAAVGKQAGRFSFECEVPTYGTVASNPVLLLSTMAGMSVAAAVATMESSVAERKTWSMKLWEGQSAASNESRIKALYGCAADMTLIFEVGKAVRAQFAGMGCWSAVADGTLPSDATHTLPLVARGMTVTIGGTAIAEMSKIEVRLRNRVEMVDSLQSSTGYKFAYIAGTQTPLITVDPNARLVATLDHYGLLLAGTPAAMVISVTDGTRTLQVDVGAAQRINIGDGERTGLRTDSIEFACRRTTNIDEQLKLTFS